VVEGRMQTRNMERMNSMRGDRGKRSLEGGGEDEQQQPERKRPALARCLIVLSLCGSVAYLGIRCHILQLGVTFGYEERSLLGTQFVSGELTGVRVHGVITPKS
ncbi:hypothetical protein Tco_1544765, partial [Tanacetum coccineum]